VSDSVDDAAGAIDAVVRALADPSQRSPQRRAVAEDLFYNPGTATARSVAELYDALALEPLNATITLAEARCQPSA